MAVHVIYRCDHPDCTSSPVETTTGFYGSTRPVAGWWSLTSSNRIFCPLHPPTDRRAVHHVAVNA
jgi:hypothetical protein